MNEITKVIRLVVLLALAVSIAAAFAAAQQDEAPQRIAGSHCGKFIVVNPIDDPENPFAGQYGDWDWWLYDNALTGDEFVDPESHPDVGRMWVDGSGWPVPMLTYYVARYSTTRDYRIDDCPYYFPAPRDLPDDLRIELASALAKVRAEELPQIPGWLADDPPVAALFTGDGEVVILGTPGSGAGLQPELWSAAKPDHGDSLRFRRYSVAGDYLSRTEPGQDWWRLYFRGFDDLVAGYGSETLSWEELNGYIVITDPGNISTFAVYDYKGGRMDDPTVVFRQKQSFKWIDGGLIPLIAAAQK